MIPECPVPEEQQPLNEYQQLQNSWFFSWASRPWPQFLKPIGWIWGMTWLVAGPIAADSFLPIRQPGKFFLMGAAGASLPVVLTLLQLYLGWRYVADRLAEPTVFYEESGWFDGQIWQKPQDVLMRDQLVMTYQVQPLLKRLEQAFGVLGLFFLGGTVAWQFL
jgi:hypothetical protein